jgi:Ser/Thr protein kinase RdoA (MazF antagonist)
MKIFCPDNFSKSVISYNVFNDDYSTFDSILSDFFSDHKIINVQKLDRLEINSSNFKVHAMCDGVENILFVRKNKLIDNKKQLVFYLDLLFRLRKAGIKVNRVLKTMDDTCFVDLEGSLYVVSEFITAQHFFPTEKNFMSVASELAKLHEEFAGLNNWDIDYIKVLSEECDTYFNKNKKYSQNDFLKIKLLIENKKKYSNHDKLVLEKMSLLLETVMEVEKKKLLFDELPRQIIHSDLHPHNLLMGDGGLKAIVDFDGMRFSERARDVGFAIYRLGRQFFVDNKKDYNYAEKLKNNFIEEYCLSNLLSEKEKDLMPYLVKDEFLRKILFVLNGIYLEDNHTWAQDVGKFLSSISEINYFWSK